MMIRDICPSLKPGTAVAHGPRFDIHRVMDVGFAVFRAFAEAMPDGSPELLVRIDEFTGWQDFDESVVLFLKTELMEDAGRFDICQTDFTLCVGRLHIGFEPFGGEMLVRQGGVWLNGDRDPLEAFDHTPKMTISRALHRADGEEATILLDGHDMRFVQTVLEPFLQAGLELDFGPVSYLRFPHEAFGDGEGTLRIEVCDENE